MLGSSLVVLLAAATATASPLHARSPYAVKEPQFLPRGWSSVGKVPSDHMIDLQIGLKQSQFDELERHLYEVSDPHHHRYGQHLTADEVHDLIKPHDETLDLVHEWLEDAGVERPKLEYSPARDWIKVSLPVDVVERLLDTEYSLYKHESGDHLVRAPEWSLPLHLHEHIESVQPTNSFLRPEPHISGLHKNKGKPILIKAEPPAGILLEASEAKSATWDPSEVCYDDFLTPLCLRTLYGTYDYVTKAAGQNKVGVTNYLNQTANRSDIGIFMSQFRKDAISAAYDFKIEIIAGGADIQTPLGPDDAAIALNDEGNLDTGTIISIAHPTPLIAYNTGGFPPFIPDINYPIVSNEPYLVWAQYVLGQKDIPQVISTSYADEEQAVPFSYATTVCKQFAQLGARGVTLLFTSGDDGVGRDPGCFTNDGKNKATFQPLFPSSCPYVTSVGGTKGFFPEVAGYDLTSSFASGGGYSNYFEQPKYQAAAVSKYTTDTIGSAYAGLYNASGRAYPDVAVQSVNMVSTWGGYNFKLTGTSVSAPVMAGIISLVNDALIAAGKPPLGFLNPWLYSEGHKAFTDITSGSAAGCGVDGFKAAAGWDAVTGWGTPNFPKILDILGLKK